MTSQALPYQGGPESPSDRAPGPSNGHATAIECGWQRGMPGGVTKAGIAPVDICDQIDELVNDQLANYPQRSGYDCPVNQDKCPHCGREWHGLKITARMEMMRQAGCYDESYRYDNDDSSVICPGSEFIGPIRSPYSPKWLNYLIEISEQYALEAISAELGIVSTFTWPIGYPVWAAESGLES
jgi:hypothetical protein